MKNTSSRVIGVIVALVLLSGSFFVGTYVGRSNADVDTSSNVINKDLGKPSNVDFSLFWKVWNTLDQNYVATHGTSTANITSQDRVYGAIQGMTAALGDPYTVFFPPEQAKDFNDEITGNFQGVGMEVGIKDGMLTVIAPLKGTPAEKAGIKPGDVILKIDGTDTTGMSEDGAVKLIRGKQGTSVKITIQRDGGTPFDVSIVRDNIDIPTINTKQLPNGVFLIQLYSFTADSSNLFRNALRQYTLSNSNKLILDLRGNPGGYLNSAVDIASWFLPPGKVVVREAFGNGKPEQDSVSKGYNIFNSNMKMAILIDGGSASASEILAGALSEYGKATLVGEKSFGKGSVQELIPVTPDTSLKVTIARWLTPDGKSISDNGITPDVVVPYTQSDATAGKDPQLDKAVQVVSE